MAKSVTSFTILALFVRPAFAESIVGDLLEEKASKGDLWFKSQVIRTAFALFRQSYLNAPTQITSLSIATVALMLSMIFISLYFLRQLDTTIMAFLLGMIITSSSSFLIGFCVVRKFPLLGIRAVTGSVLFFSLMIIILEVQFFYNVFLFEFNSQGHWVASRNLVVLFVLNTILLSCEIILPLMLGGIVSNQRIGQVAIRINEN